MKLIKKHLVDTLPFTTNIFLGTSQKEKLYTQIIFFDVAYLRYQWMNYQMTIGVILINLQTIVI